MAAGGNGNSAVEAVALGLLSVDKLPVCPAVLSGLERVLRDPDTTITDLARLLSTDPSLTIKVLRLVNSTLYSLPRRVNTVEEACFRLGFREVWSLAVAAQMNSVYREAERQRVLVGLWDHSLKVGLMARMIAARVPGHQPEDCFTAGVLHDVGKLALGLHSPEACREIYEAGLTGRAIVAKERRRWGVGHDDLGGILLRRWRLPEMLAGLVERHHDPGWAGTLDHQAAAICAADALAHATLRETLAEGPGLVRLDFDRADLSPNVTQSLNLDPSECVRIVAETTRAFDDMARHFQ
jgi:HD-like signal output (HDOD) protein